MENRRAVTGLEVVALTMERLCDIQSTPPMRQTGYSGTPLWKKLGYRQGIRAYVDGAPTSYVPALLLPADITVQWVKRAAAPLDFAHLFVSVQARLKEKLPTFRKLIEPDGVIWISWPKKSSGVTTDITEETVRLLALPLGLVDIKVCAVDEVWSGLKLVIRKELRQ
jgi:hypothetical protein